MYKSSTVLPIIIDFSLRITFGDIQSPTSNRTQWELNGTMPADNCLQQELKKGQCGPEKLHTFQYLRPPSYLCRNDERYFILKIHSKKENCNFTHFTFLFQMRKIYYGLHVVINSGP